MHTIHTTPGFIIDARPYGEADKMLSIFTRDLGLVWAIAKGIRLERSKLRYFAGEHSFGTYSLVRGKEFWRLTSAQEGESATPIPACAADLVARLALLLRRLLQGEEAHPELFGCIEECAAYLRTSQDLSEDRLQTLESLTVFRIMHALGYIGADERLSPDLPARPVTASLLDELSPKRCALNDHINKAMKESHL